MSRRVFDCFAVCGKGLLSGSGRFRGNAGGKTVAGGCQCPGRQGLRRPAAAQRLEDRHRRARRLHPGLRLCIQHAQQAFIRLQHLDQADHALVVGGACGLPGPRERIRTPGEHGHQLLPLVQRDQGVLHFFRGAQYRLPVGGKAFRLLCLRLVDLGVDATEVEQPPAQAAHNAGLRCAGAEEIARGDGGGAADQAADRQLRVVLGDRHADACVRRCQAPLRRDEVRASPQQIAGRLRQERVGSTGTGRGSASSARCVPGAVASITSMALRAASSAFSSGGMVACARASALNLAQLKLGCQALVPPQFDDGAKLLLGPHLRACHCQPRLQAANLDIDVRSLGGHREPHGSGAGFRCLVLGQGGLPGPAQAAEEIKLPTGPEVGLLGAAVAIEPRHGVEHPAQRSLDRLIAPGRLRRDLGRRQQRSCRRVQPGACLKHAASGLGNIQVLLQCRRDEARHLRIAKGCPPGCKVRGESGEGGLPSPRTRPPCRPGAGPWRAAGSQGLPHTLHKGWRASERRGRQDAACSTVRSVTTL